jgi:hypothetical protein
MSWRGVPSSTMRPAFIISTQSHMRSTSSMLCEASSSEAPVSRQ